MGSTKNFYYSEKNISISLLGRALAHPCRVTIVELLIDKKELNNLYFSNYFGMTKSTIHDHLVKLWQAGLIEVNSSQFGTLISMNDNQIALVDQLLSFFSFDTKDAYHLGVLS